MLRAERLEDGPRGLGTRRSYPTTVCEPVEDPRNRRPSPRERRHERYAAEAGVEPTADGSPAEEPEAAAEPEEQPLPRDEERLVTDDAVEAASQDSDDDDADDDRANSPG